MVLKNSSPGSLKPSALGSRQKHGRDVVVWDELINHWKNSYTVKPVVMAYSSPERIKASVAKGFTSIFAPTFPLYFDILQVSPAQTEIDAPYIGGYGDGYVNSVDKVYNVNPMAMVSGKEKLLLGAQACLWTESCNNNAAAEYQLYPRLLALSEMSWLPQAKRRFTEFLPPFANPRSFARYTQNHLRETFL